MKRTHPHLTSFAAGLLALLSPVSATVSITSAGYTNDFSAAPVAGDWITSGSNIAGTDATFTDVAGLDAFIAGYNASGLTTAVGSSGTNPPSVHELARLNTTLGAVQMRPRAATTIKAANVLVLRMQNDTGALIPRLDVAYDFANPGAGVEEIPGWHAYYSVTGNGGWTKIPEFSTAVPGPLSASLNFGGAGWSAGTLLHILWVDDNSSAGDASDGNGEASYTMDNIAVTVPLVGTISANLSNVVRTPGTNPPADDTVTFDVTITGNLLPPGTPGWTTTGAIPPTPVTGAYGSTITVPNVPVSALPLTITLADQADPTIIGNFTVSAASLPRYVALNRIGAPAYVVLDGTSAPAWTGNGLTMVYAQTNGGGTVPHVASSAPVTFTAGAPKFASLTIEAQDSSTGSNFETEDLLKVELVTDAGTEVLTGVLDKNNNGFINGYSNPAAPEPQYDTVPLTDEFNRGGVLMAGTFTNTWRLHGRIPAAATTAHVVITGLNNATTETWRVRDVIFGNAADSDGDGAWDSEEAVTGTNPNDAASLFRLLSQGLAGGDYSVTVPTVSTRLYQLDTSTDLINWRPQAAAVQGTDADMTLTTPADTARKFTRVTVQ